MIRPLLMTSACAMALAALPAAAQDGDLPPTVAALASAEGGLPVTYGPRPFNLIAQMEDGPLRSELEACMGQTPAQSQFSVGHRGAPLQFPEHTVEANVAAAVMGAGVLECDVTFTADRELVCRHAQNDLHTTTNIVTTDLAETCVTPFSPASGEDAATAECRTSELTLAEFRTLTPLMDAANGAATTPEEYIAGGTADWRTDLYSEVPATLMTHAESIRIFDALGADFTPELKAPSVEMPFDGDYSQEDYAQALVDEYVEAGIDPSRVWLQSFDLDDVLYWIEATPEFGAQAVYLDDRYSASDEDEGLVDPMDAATFVPGMQELADMGVNYIAPPMWMLVTLDDAGEDGPVGLCRASQRRRAGDHHLDARALGSAHGWWRLVFPVGLRRGGQRRCLFRDPRRAGPGRRRRGRVLGLAGNGHLLRQLHGPRVIPAFRPKAI